MLQIEQHLRGGLIPRRRVHLQRAQDHLLQPFGKGRDQRARRLWVAPQARAHLPQPFRLSEGFAPCRQLIGHGAQREDVAAQIVALPQVLLGRDIGEGAHRNLELFRQQIGQLVMPRQAKVDADHVPGRTAQEIGRLQVQMRDMLAVQVMHGPHHRHRKRHHFIRRARCGPKQRQQRPAVDPFGHQIGHHRKIAHGDHPRHMHAGQARQDHLLHLEADNRRCVIAVQDRGHFHDHRQRMIRMGHIPDRGEAAAIETGPQGEPVNLQPLMRPDLHPQLPLSNRSASVSGSPAARTFAAVAAQS